jgi:putative serine protease PepD
VTAGSGGWGSEGATGGTGRASAWWSDAENDPWRNPESSAVIVHPSTPVPPPPEPVGETLAPRTELRRTVVVAAMVGLLAGGLGGALGFVAATHRAGTPVVIGATHGGGGQLPAGANTAAALVARVMPSVVTVQGATVQGSSLGSGFVLTDSGYILTNDHVLTDVPDNAIMVTLADGTSMQAKMVGRDPESDLAVLKVDRTDLKPVELGDSDQVSVGDDVLAIGAPLALSGTVTRGIVSALDRPIATRDSDGVDRYYAAIQTDAAVNRGNSGGPLFDAQGRVIGVNAVIKSTVENSEEAGNIGIAFAIPMNQAARVSAELIKSGHAHRTVIGAQFDTTGRAVGTGVRLSTVDAGGPAASAGLQVGDLVTKIGNHSVFQPSDLIALVRQYAPGTVVPVIYRRGADTQTANVTLVADAN